MIEAPLYSRHQWRRFHRPSIICGDSKSKVYYFLTRLQLVVSQSMPSLLGLINPHYAKYVEVDRWIHLRVQKRKANEFLRKKVILLCLIFIHEDFNGLPLGLALSWWAEIYVSIKFSKLKSCRISAQVVVKYYHILYKVPKLNAQTKEEFVC